MNYWPGTKIVKSSGNAFTSWKAKPSVMSDKSIKQSLIGKQNALSTPRVQITYKKDSK